MLLTVSVTVTTEVYNSIPEMSANQQIAGKF